MGGADLGLGCWLAKGPRVWKGGKGVAGKFWDLKGLAAWCNSPIKTVPQSFCGGPTELGLYKSKVAVYFCTWVTSRFPVGQYCGMSLSCLHWCLPSLPTTNCVHSQQMTPLFPSSYPRAGSRPVLYVIFSLFYIYDPWSVCIWAQCACPLKYAPEYMYMPTISLSSLSRVQQEREPCSRERLSVGSVCHKC